MLTIVAGLSNFCITVIDYTKLSFIAVIPLRGKVRKASITDKVEKSRVSQAYIDTIKVTFGVDPLPACLTPCSY